MEFVTFELSKKLKEKGFPQVEKETLAMYDEDGGPTISQVLKWLREEKKIFVVIAVNPTFATKDKIAYYYNVYFNSDGVTICHYESEEGYAQWEDCAIYSIKYILDNLI